MFTLAKLIMLGVLITALLGAYTAWHHSIIVQGRTEGIALQFKEDKPVLSSCIKYGMIKPDGKNADTERCAQYIDQLVTANKELAKANADFELAQLEQQKGAKKFESETAARLADSQKLLAKQATTLVAFSTEQDRLQSIVSDTKAGKLTCEATLAQTN